VRQGSWGARSFMPACRAHRFTAYQTTLAVTPASCRIPPFKTRLNTFPSLTPERRSQALRSSSLHDGTGTVRIPSTTDANSRNWITSPVPELQPRHSQKTTSAFPWTEDRLPCSVRAAPHLLGARGVFDLRRKGANFFFGPPVELRPHRKSCDSPAAGRKHRLPVRKLPLAEHSDG